MSEKPEGYYIAAVSRTTGLSADTIRSWERRYGRIRPQRDAAGLRLYSGAEIARLKLARQATELGHPIRKVAALSDDAIAALLEPLPASSAGDLGMPGTVVTALLDALRANDPQRLKRTIVSAAMLVEPDDLILQILIPLLHEVGKLWYEGRVLIWQEHLLSELVGSTTGIFTRISETPSSNGGFLFATPPHERHAFGIAFAAMLASSRGVRAHNLGPSVPAEELVAAAKSLDARCVVIGITGAGDAALGLDGYFDELDRGLPGGYRDMGRGPVRASR